ncbi:cytochrome P460 [Chryseobacterium sp. T16E-39]|uniref:heme-binding domain-containing protein n=1 Tax=Chryseobacterium sp. T16E-39 TaxID=2015076 RepID=UPI000B5B13C3|nr:heme-binding domain-containing protein [Chryseobacterium sp. T16E-39]ASK29818.1 cytochrome P460 [Chryseobacterium sp. T16E-39]
MDSVKKKRTVKPLAILLIAILGTFAGLQLYNPPIEGKPVTGTIEAPHEVVEILERSCFNCHSNEQKLSWYDQLAPLSWAVKKDVDRAREVMNFSEWSQVSPGEHKGRMYSILNMMQAGKMPLHEYTLLHASAKISAKDIEVIRKYTLSLSGKGPASVNKEIKDAHQEIKFASSASKTFPVSPNGVQYTPEFKNWKVISMSTLFDNSIRVIYGNDTAVKAVETENFHPWPDGSIVVKAVWKQSESPDGEIRPGEFINAQFMVKDSKKYTDTEGWGFAKFSGKDLHPTGKTASFAKESCIACHRQLAEPTGYLFDVPMKVNTKSLIEKLQKK